MARRNSHKTSKSSQHHDFLDELDNDSRYTALQPASPPRIAVPVRRLRDIEDRRNWAPAGQARDFAGRPARVVYKAKSPKVLRGPGGKPLQSRPTVFRRLETGMPRFAEAAKTVICFKRKVRREVLHALKQKHSGKGSPKKRNEWSDVQC